jgi:hypothetical protein
MLDTKCTMCETRVADLRVETEIIPLSARGERLIEKQANKNSRVTTFACVECFVRGMQAAADWNDT